MHLCKGSNFPPVLLSDICIMHNTTVAMLYIQSLMYGLCDKLWCGWTNVAFMLQTIIPRAMVLGVHHSQSLDGAERLLCLVRLDEFDPLPPTSGTLNWAPCEGLAFSQTRGFITKPVSWPTASRKCCIENWEAYRYDFSYTECASGWSNVNT